MSARRLGSARHLGLRGRALAMVGGLAACAAPGPRYVEVPMMTPASASVAASPLPSPAPVAPIVSDAPPFVGTWVGVGTQDDGQSWPMTVRITSTAGVCAVASYVSLSCVAEWRCRGLEGAVLVASEHLRTGQGRCVDEGEMQMQVEGGMLEWSWRGKGQTANATLRRVP